MKNIFLIFWIVLLSCNPSKKSSNNGFTENNSSTNQGMQGVPECLQNMIKQYQSEEKQNPPRQVYSYLYDGRTVYYVTPPCCDFFSDLYDSSCVLIGHPDGGITGRGDGKVVDFKEKRTNEKLIWKDERK